MIPKPPARGFERAEFEHRLDRAQQGMQADGLGCLLLTTEPDVRYFSGFLTQFWQSPTRPWFLVVPARGKPVAVIPAIGEACMGRTWIEDIRTWPSPDPEDDGIGLVARTIREVSGGGAIGLPMGAESHVRLPLGELERLRAALAGYEWRDATPLIRRQRMVKSGAEIEKIAYICAVASETFEAVPRLIAAGDNEIEAFRKFKIALLENGADDVSYLVGAAGPGGYGDIISPPGERSLAEGDVLILDTGSQYDGYFCDFDRNYAVGKPDDAVRRAHETVYAATEAGLAAARPGARASDLYGAMWRVLEDGGALGNGVGRLGHGLGTQLTEWPSHTSFDHTVLAEGMVLTLEPGMEFAPGRMMVHEENIVIRDGEPQLLSRRAPAELPVIGP